VEHKPAPPLQGSLIELNQSSRGSRPGLFCLAPSGPMATHYLRSLGLETISLDRTSDARIKDQSNTNRPVLLRTQDGGSWPSDLRPGNSAC
jgi:hypothetical protein